METHAHHLHKAPSHGWKHYLFEFLMLFLAVFCGFLAENQREHFVEQKRAKEYAKSMLTDLRTDTNEIRRGISLTKFIISSIDSLVSISNNRKKDNEVPGRFYYYSRFSSALFRIDWSKSTIDQLVQSGNLRYFTNKKLVERINRYYYMQGIIGEQNSMDGIIRDKIVDSRNRILQSRYYSSFIKLDPLTEQYGHARSTYFDSLMNNSLALQAGGENGIDEFINHSCDRESRLKVYIDQFYPSANEIAEEIISLLIKEYHLE